VFFFKDYLFKIEHRAKENNPITRKEIKKQFLAETERALFSLSYAAGMITLTKNGKLGIKPKKEISVSSKQFSNSVKKAYFSEINEKNGLHLQKHYVEIYKIRDIISSKFGWEENFKFDKMFSELLSSKQGGEIQIHGAAPQWFTEKGLDLNDIAFREEGKVYIFMSL